MKRFILHSLLIVGFLAAFAVGPFVSTASAAPTEEQCQDEDYRKALEEFYKLNNLGYYDACSEAVCSTGSVQSDSPIKLEKTPTITAIYTYLTTTPISTNGGKPLTPVQVSGIMGNFYAESSFNPSAIEDTSRAEKGHGLAQWTFGRWSGSNGLQQFAISQGKAWDDVTVQLDFLKKELEGSEQGIVKDAQFTSTVDPSVAAMRWRIVFERADPDLAHDDKRTGAAIAVYNLFGGVAADCDLTSSVVSGNFLDTARNLALKTPATDTMSKQSDARDTYVQAKPKYNPEPDWSDCGAYVATAMIASGVDPNYVKVGTVYQEAYVRAHPEKYVIHEKPTLADLKPGDILFISGHTTIYSGDKEYPMLDASLTQRVPSVRPTVSLQYMLAQPDLVSARVLK